jgi:hypothetical protein
MHLLDQSISLRASLTMELLVFSPEDFRPRSRYFDGPVMLGVQQAVGENAEVVPGFTSISHHGVIHRCVAYCDRDAKKNNRPINAWATALWHTALKRAGFERGLRRDNGGVADWLNGTVVVIYSGGLLDTK